MMITIASARYCFTSSRPQLHEAWDYCYLHPAWEETEAQGSYGFAMCLGSWNQGSADLRPPPPPRPHQPPVWESRFFLPGEGAFSTFLDEKHKHHQRQKNKGTRKEKLKNRKHEKRWEETKLKMCHNQQNWIYLPN